MPRATLPRRLAALIPSLALLLGLLPVLGGLGGCASEPPPPTVRYVDTVVVKKGERKLQLVQNHKVVKEYRVALGANPRGHKTQEGDERTPEGEYILDWRNPASTYHKSIHISYPNAMDRAVARSLGVQPGGMIMIHGRPNYITSPRIHQEYDRRDWTNGCIAVTNQEMDEIWRLVRDGTPIRILP